MPTSPPFPPDAPPGVPLLITRRQRAELRDLGFTDDDIHVMTPDEAHRRLAEVRTATVQAKPG